VLQPNIKTFIDNKAIGIMEQGSYQERGAEFQELKAYLIAKLMWEPDIDADLVIDDFMLGYYGRSGQYIRDYFDLLQRSVTPETHFGIGLDAWDPLFTDELVEESIRLFTKAKKVADNEKILRRVNLAELPILYLKCKREPVKSREDGTFHQFIRTLEKEGIELIAEYRDNLENFKKQVLSAKE
jgi:hypothetical protein